MITIMKELQIKLKGKGIRPSYHRLKVLEYLEKYKTHPTVDMIYEFIKKEVPTVSKTTVYNTLNSFLKMGMVIPLTISGNEIRYEYQLHPHSHFLCKKCGAVIDIDNVVSSYENKHLLGNQVDEAHLYLRGVCHDCLKKNKE